MYVPENLTDLLEYLDSHQQGVQLIANGSDLITRIRRREVAAEVIVDLSGLEEFNYIQRDGDTIRIGALTTITDLASSPVLDWRYAAFQDSAAKFGGPAIRNVATVGGNICAASSSEDLLPILLVLDAKVRLRNKYGERVVPLGVFLRGKRRVDLKANEILTETVFQEIGEDSICAFEKIGMRNSLIIAFVSAAVYLRLDKKTRIVEEVRVAFNRVAGKVPERARKTEEELRGRVLTSQVVEDTCSVLRSEMRLSSDFRVSGEYRSDVACVLFKRALGRCYKSLVGKEIV
jgi:CO/xanthine dehydrogenase FAD-binding subunit